MPLLQLEGFVDTRDQEIASLRRQLAQLDEALRLERIKTGAVEAGIRKLKSATSPLFHALQMIHGEIDAMGIDASSGTGSQGNAKWESIKQRLAPRLKEAIDIFLAQGSMNLTNLAAALKMDYSNCSKNVAGVLLRQGLLVKNGRELSLKDLP